jgi:hypothetical protein
LSALNTAVCENFFSLNLEEQKRAFSGGNEGAARELNFPQERFFSAGN